MQDIKHGVNTMTGVNGKEFEIVDSPVPKEFELIDKYWKASNYLAVGQVRQQQHTKIFSSSLVSTKINSFSNAVFRSICWIRTLY